MQDQYFLGAFSIKSKLHLKVFNQSWAAAYYWAAAYSASASAALPSRVDPLTGPWQ